MNRKFGEEESNWKIGKKNLIATKSINVKTITA